jgi:NAD(P)-dependent dehydrogenase (short-subunit alcohol dehydrogenase family)/acyl carrier protein
MSRRIREIQDLESRGGEVLYLAADVARRDEMEAVVARGRETFGPVHGLIHAAGIPGGGILQLKEPEAAARVMAPKVEGTLVLESVLRDEPLDFVLLCSSIASLAGGFGQIDYCAANAFLDAHALRAASTGGPLTLSVNWDAWREVGMAVNTAVPAPLQAARALSLKVGIAPAEGTEAFSRILAARLPQVVVLTMDARPALVQAHLRRASQKPVLSGAEPAPAEAPAADGAPAGNDLERVVIESWERILGRQQIGVNDNFFELGGDSLAAMQVVALLKTRLGREIPIVAFYEAPTVGLLARALSEGAAEEKPTPLDGIDQRAESRLEMMERRRRKRERPAADQSGLRA